MTATAIKTQPQTETKMEVVKKTDAAPAVLTLDEKIAQVENLSLLISKWQKLNESKKRLVKFQIGSDGLSSNLVLRDGAGNEFNTSNLNVVTDVLGLIRITLDKSIAEVESKIHF